jgi:deazaflavin-dependent oxidoreductase (nitroreductase family)
VWVLVAWLVLRTFWVLAFRFQVRTVIDEVRAFNKRILNPAMMKLAGRRHWYASVIRHRGRRSGKEYATPVVAEPTEEDFIVPLPYGENVDWLKNVVAAGRATIAAKGETYAVGEPEIIDAGAAFSLLRPRVRHKWRLFGIGRWLKVKRLPDCAAPEDRPDGFARIERPSP